MIVTITIMVTLPSMVTIHRTVTISRKVTIPRMITISMMITISRTVTTFKKVWPKLAPFVPIWPHFAPFDHIWPRLAWFNLLWPRLASFGPVWRNRINLYERKVLEGTPKEYQLGIDGRLKDGWRAKLGLHPYQEGQCHKGIFHGSKIAFMESVRKNWTRLITMRSKPDYVEFVLL